MRNRATLIMEDGASQTACVHDLLLIYAVCVCACVRAPVCSACPPNWSFFYLYAFNRFWRVAFNSQWCASS